MVGPHGATFANLLVALERTGARRGRPGRSHRHQAGLLQLRRRPRCRGHRGRERRGRVADLIGSSNRSGCPRRRLVGRPAAGVSGSTDDLATSGAGLAALRRHRADRRATDSSAPTCPTSRASCPALADSPPVRGESVPKFAATSNTGWATGPRRSFGHFGQSGSMMLLNVDEGIAVVATSSEPFGAWAVKLWPEWTSAAAGVWPWLRELGRSSGSPRP